MDFPYLTGIEQEAEEITIAIPLIIFLLMIFVTSFFFTMKKRLVGCLMLIILIAGSAALGYMLITGVITLPI